MAYEIVAYAPELLPQILQLQTQLWSGDPARNAAYFTWKYADNPFLDEVVMRLALCDGRVVAMRGMFGAAWQVDGAATSHLLPYADDFVVAREHRNRGVAGLIMRAALDDGARRAFPFAVSLSAGAVTFVSSLAVGWRAAGSYHSVWRTVHAGRLTRWWGRFASMLETPAPQGRYDHLDRAARRRSARLSLERAPRPAEMAALIERLPWDGRIRHMRDAAYLAWRFRNPLHEYRFLFWDDGGLQGYLVLQRYLSEYADQSCVNIVDWEAADERIRAELLGAALDWGRFPRVHAWTVGTGEPVRALLRERGFTSVEAHGVRARSGGLLVCRLAATGPAERWLLGSRDLLQIADWDLRMLYSMAG